MLFVFSRHARAAGKAFSETMTSETPTPEDSARKIILFGLISGVNLISSRRRAKR